jgi:hypothetical protein
MADKIPVDGEKGDFYDLKIGTVDETGFPLVWTLKFEDDGKSKSEYWEAIGRDNKRYKIVEDVVKPPKDGKVIVEVV